MEGTKQSGSSSLTSDLFGSKDSSVSSGSGIFASLFPPPPKGLGSGCLRPEAVEKKQDPASQAWNARVDELVEKKQDPASQAWNARVDESENVRSNSEGENMSNPNMDWSSFYEEQKVQPCHLSSSIYYGGQDVYSPPQNPNSSVHTTFSKDVEDDDSGFASRGNWWQGSLYY